MDKNTITIADFGKNTTILDPIVGCMLDVSEITAVLAVVKGANMFWSYVDFAKAIIEKNDSKRLNQKALEW